MKISKLILKSLINLFRTIKFSNFGMTLNFFTIKLYVNIKKIKNVIKLAIKVPRATPNIFKSNDKTNNALKTIFNVERTIINKLEILVF